MSTIETSPFVGIRPMPSDEYHADKSAWSRSMIADFRDRRSICHARHILGTAPEQKASKVMELGDLAHAALLEPHKLEGDEFYVAIPDRLLSSDGGIRSNDAKKWVEERQSSGAVVLKPRDFETVQAMVASVKAKVGSWITSDARIEHAIYWIDDGSGLRCRCRPDVLVERDDIVFCLDVKTTGDVSPGKFRRRIEDCDLLLQDSHYSDGIRLVTGKDVRFLFVAVESSWPFTCAVYEIEQSQRATGWAQRRMTLLQISGCIETGLWCDDWEDDINVVTLSKYATTIR